MVGPRHMQIFVDPPPRRVFTYEDMVSGKLVFDSTRDEKIGFVYMYFNGVWITALLKFVFLSEKFS
jgi:hypothetical protein